MTDLDHEGRLEIFKAKHGGEGIAPELRCEELAVMKEQRESAYSDMAAREFYLPVWYGIEYGGAVPGNIIDLIKSKTA